jgi:hypothetical protein
VLLKKNLMRLVKSTERIHGISKMTRCSVTKEAAAANSEARPGEQKGQILIKKDLPDFAAC